VVAAVLAVLGVAGAFGNLAAALAPVGKQTAAAALAGAIRIGAVAGAVALAAVGLVALGRQTQRIPAAAFAVALPLIVGGDLWRDGRRYWEFQPPPRQGLYREDPITARLRQEPLPYRILDLSAVMRVEPAYPLNVLQGHGVPQVLGYFGFELRYYDELLGGKNEWRYLLTSTRLWDLLAVKFLITPDTMPVPGYHRVLGPVETGSGGRAFLYEADSPPPYARVVPAAVPVEPEQIPPTLADPRLPGFDRVVFVPPDAPIGAASLTDWPPPSPALARVTAWRAGAMTIALDPPPPEAGYLLVAENWYVDWRAAVDGNAAPVLRGDHSLITVPLPAGAQRVQLTYRSATYARGKAISFVALATVLAGIVVPAVRRRRRERG
jgi:hypothetical protein